jgi:leader peptidase (prepilin peptidase)/N-methyltransferase
MDTLFYVVWYFFVFVFGTIIFSFLNVVIYRTPLKLSFARGRSFCPKCHHTLHAVDLVPLFSWLFLGGKCRYCRTPISKRYPLVETIGGICALLCCVKFVDPMALTLLGGLRALLYFYMCAVLTVIAFIDWDTMTILDSTNVAVLLGGIASIFLFKDITWLQRLIGVFCISLPMYILVLIKEGAFGGGDIKLFAALGVFFGWKMTLLVFFISILIGGVYAGVSLASQSKKRGEHFAFGPYICMGAFAVMMWGPQLLNWYMDYLGF